MTSTTLKASTRTRSSRSTTVLGIDPGIRRIGYGIVGASGHQFTFRDAGLLVPSARSIPPSLARARQALRILLQRYHPSLAAMEKIYFVQNRTSAMGVSEFRGVVRAELEDRKIPLVEISPTEVKTIMCGYGRADKSAIRKMVLLEIDAPPSLRSRDAVDALAIAIAGWFKRYD